MRQLRNGKLQAFSSVLYRDHTFPLEEITFFFIVILGLSSVLRSLLRFELRSNPVICCSADPFILIIKSGHFCWSRPRFKMLAKEGASERLRSDGAPTAADHWPLANANCWLQLPLEALPWRIAPCTPSLYRRRHRPHQQSRSSSSSRPHTQRFSEVGDWHAIVISDRWVIAIITDWDTAAADQL